MQERDLFDAARALPDAAARRAYLAAAAGGDEALARRVEALLLAYEGAGSFLERPAFLDGGADGGPTQALPSSDERADAPGDDEDGDPLDFLVPSGQPGSLGRLAHYEVLEVLGRGGFGTVVRAFDEKLHRAVAIKVMARGLAATSPPRKRFLREARAAAAVRHEHVVSIHAVDEQPVPYLVMEYVAGPTLQQKLDRSGPIEVPEVLRIGHEIAAGLAAAHRQGLIHRDIKPANILLEDAAERVKITDFGLARAADDASLTQSGVIAGTPMYMAPEQALGEAIDRRADLFSLGSVLYVMCTGRPPFRAPSTLAVLRRVAEDAPRPIREVIPEVPADLCDLIARLHAKNPADRFASAEEVAESLKGQLEAHRSPPRAQPAAAPPRPAARRKPAPLDSEFLSGDRRRAQAKGDPTLPAGSSLGTLLVWSFVAVLVLVGLVAVEQYRRPSRAVAVAPAPLVPLPPPAAPAEPGTLEISIDDLNAEILVTGDGTSVVSPGGTWNHLFKLRPGKYRYTARRAGRVVGGGETFIESNRPQRVQMFVGSKPEVARLPNDLGPWGRFEDPAGECRATANGTGLAIAIPANLTCDLNPRPGFDLDAPRVFQDAEGDFAVQVQVLPFPAANNAKGVVYRWAGLVVWADEHHFVRLGSAEYPGGEDKRPFVDLESFRGPQQWEDDIRHDSSPPTHFRAERRGDSLILKTSTDGRTWTYYRAISIAGYPPKLRVGVAAIKAGAETFTARFDGWTRESIGPIPEPGRSAGGFGPWGSLVDPIDGSKATQSGDRLTIAVPGDVIRDLNPTSAPLKNLHAPRAVQAVTGDFTVTVDVPVFPKAKLNAIAAPEGRAYQFAGLLIWADRSDFLRFGIARNLLGNDGAPFLTFEFFRESRSVAGDTDWPDEIPTRFQAERRGDTLMLKVRAADGEWRPYKTCDLAGMPAQVYVGVTAVNTTPATFAPEFAGWSLRATSPVAPEVGAGGPIAGELGSWGRFVDPKGGSRARRDGDRGTITMPVASPRDLNPTVNDTAAPRVVADVVGDFKYEVTVPPFPVPDAAASVDGGGNVYHWFGPVVWADERNFFRFGVGRSTVVNDGAPDDVLECFRDGRGVVLEGNAAQAATTHFQLERRGDTLFLRRSADGQRWSAFRTCSLVGMPARLQVGVAAVNTGNDVFAPEFVGGRLQHLDAVAPDPGGGPIPAAPDLGPWGRLVTPVAACRATRDGDRLTIELPAGAPCDLNPAPEKDLAAPRLLRAVDGDFTAQVQLVPSPRPGRNADAAPRDQTYHFAGLLVWADERNFLRFGVNGNSSFEEGTPCLDLQFFRNLKDIAGDVRYAGKDSIYVQAERRGDKLTLRTSPDGRTWTAYRTCTLAGLPAKLSIGITAINTGVGPYSPRFAGWSLAAAGGAAPRAAADFTPWGALVDPPGGGAASWRDAGLILAAPGDRLRDLNPIANQNLDAPRVLKAVTGDFTAEVIIPPFPAVRRDAIRAGRPNAYHGASLVVWADPDNFLRFDRGSLVSDRDGAPQLRFELFRNSELGAGKVRWAADGPARLQVERRGETLIVRTSDDGRTWTDYESAALPAMRAEVWVGVAAVNTGTDEFAPRFEGWSLRPADPARP